MTDRPILMSGSMVRACWDGRKTQTRRILKPQPVGDPTIEDGFQASRRFAVGDRLWVREAWRSHRDHDQIPPRDLLALHSRSVIIAHEEARGEPPEWLGRKRPGIHMPRWASRMTLAVTEVRVQRLQEISKDDVIAEGIAERDGLPISEAFAGWHEPFACLWESINGAGSWNQNPFVAAVSFSAHRCNIDTMGSTSTAAVTDCRQSR